MHRAAPADVRLFDVLERYWTEHGCKVASATSVEGHIAAVAELIGPETPVSAFGIKAQQRLVEALQAQGRAPGGVKRIFATVKAAVVWAWRAEIITAHPPFLRGLPDGEPRERVMSIGELARLWDAAEQPHIQAFMMVMLCTLCRPGAALELTGFACDLDRGIIELNPPGRARTKKRRPAIPLANALRPWVMQADGHLVQYRGKPLKKINSVWRNVRDLAGFGADVIPLTIRHTMASELRARGVPELELAGVLGHVMPNIRTTGRYAKYSPSYLGEARNAIDAVVGEMGRLASRSIVPHEPLTRIDEVLIGFS